MASIRANILTKILKGVSYSDFDEDTLEAVEVARRKIQILARVPMASGTRELPAGIPNVRAVWHVGTQILPDIRLVYFHGGGYCTGSPQTHRHFTSTLAKLTGIPILSVDYRRAPEDPCPAQLEDGLAAYEWAANNGPQGPSTARKVFIGGDSAGGGLTLSVAQALRDRQALLPGGLVMLSPWLDTTITADSVRRLGHVDFMISERHGQRWSRYVRNGRDPLDPVISPLFGDFHGLPPIYLCIGGQEILLDDALRAVEKAHAAGVPVTFEREEEMFHIWPIFGFFLPEGAKTTENIALWLNRRR